jgi:LmbE family N-acetylglucosaminyl deacetylase
MRFICIGAHPDDCEIEFGGTAALLAEGGHAVKFLSVTNGDAGHMRSRGEELARTRLAEAREAARRLDIAETETLDNHDGELIPNLQVRREIVRRIREWRADAVLSHRPFDYHPDHRYTSQLVQDSAYLVLVPNICPETKPLQQNPVYLYLEDRFQKPSPFTPTLVVDIDRVWDRKIHAMDAHASQFYEWLPWVEGDATVPDHASEREAWLSSRWSRPIAPAVREALIQRYGKGRGCATQHAEAFELCEYGSRPTPEELERIFV